MPDNFEELSNNHFALMRVPLLEGGEAYWVPVVCGHEVAHLAIAEDADPVRTLLGSMDLSILDPFELPHLPDFDEELEGPLALSITFSWVEEILW